MRCNHTGSPAAPFNVSINQSFNQPINPSITRSFNQPINQARLRPMSKQFIPSIIQAKNTQPISQTTNQSVNQRSIHQSINHTSNQSINRLASNSGVAQWLACWAHNPKVRGSKPRSAMCAVGNCARAKKDPLPLVKCDSCSPFMFRGRPHIAEILYRNHKTKTCVAKHYSANGAQNTAARAPHIFHSISLPAPHPSSRADHAFI